MLLFKVGIDRTEAAIVGEISGLRSEPAPEGNRAAYTWPDAPQGSFLQSNINGLFCKHIVILF